MMKQYVSHEKFINCVDKCKSFREKKNHGKSKSSSDKNSSAPTLRIT